MIDMPSVQAMEEGKKWRKGIPSPHDIVFEMTSLSSDK